MYDGISKKILKLSAGVYSPDELNHCQECGAERSVFSLIDSTKSVLIIFECGGKSVIDSDNNYEFLGGCQFDPKYITLDKLIDMFGEPAIDMFEQYKESLSSAIEYSKKGLG